MNKAIRIESLGVDDFSLIDDGLSQGLIQAFSQCPRKFLYRINRWRKKQDKPNTLFGTINHDVLDSVYTTGESSENHIDNWIDEVLTSEGQNNSFGELQAAKAFCTLVEYCNYYGKDQRENKYGQPEEVFCIEYGKRGIYAKRRGKIDGQFYPGKRSKLWILERKTMARIDENTLMTYLNFDFQSFYYVISKEDKDDEQVHGVLYDIIRNPGTKPHKGEDLLDYIDRLRDDIQTRPEHYFMRFEIPIIKKDKLYFVNEVQRKVKDIFFKLQACKKDTPYKVFYRNQCSCRSGFACNFLEACSTGCLRGYEQSESIFPELEV